MAINKVIYGNDTLIDISNTTAEESDVENGKIFHKKDGTQGTGNYQWTWMGHKPEFIKNVLTEEVALEDTTYPDWTPSTTAKAIRATANADTFVADLVNYEYIIRWKISCNPIYTEGTVLKAATIRECLNTYQHIFKRPNSVTNIRDKNFNSNACVTVCSAPLAVYYKTDGTTITYTYSVSYGLYGALTAATFSSTTSNTPTVTVKKPTLNARCSTSYFSTAMAAAIDQENTKFKIVGDLYRIPKGGIVRTLYEELCDLYVEE